MGATPGRLPKRFRCCRPRRHWEKGIRQGQVPAWKSGGDPGALESWGLRGRREVTHKLRAPHCLGTQQPALPPGGTMVHPQLRPEQTWEWGPPSQGLLSDRVALPKLLSSPRLSSAGPGAVPEPGAPGKRTLLWGPVKNVPLKLYKENVTMEFHSHLPPKPSFLPPRLQAPASLGSLGNPRARTRVGNFPFGAKNLAGLTAPKGSSVAAAGG